MIRKFKNLFYRFRYRTVFEALQYRLESIGISVSPYYWIREGLNDNSLPEFQNNLESYSFEFFGPEEIKAIVESKAWKYSEEQLLSWLKEGKKCFGAKYHGQIAAFMWIDFNNSNCKWHRFPLKDDEAYLFDMYTMKPFRGKGVAPYLRYQSYKILKDMGRYKCYSYSDFFNSPSIKFKKKLNANFLKIGLYIELFKKYRWNWIIKNYNT